MNSLKGELYDQYLCLICIELHKSCVYVCWQPWLAAVYRIVRSITRRSKPEVGGGGRFRR